MTRGKYAGTRLHQTKPATAANPRTIADVLAAMERLAATSGDLKALFIVGECRRALAAGDAAGAAWAAWTLAQREGRNKLDAVAEPVRRDHARQNGTGQGGRNKRQGAASVWQGAANAAVRAKGPDCTAKQAWRWAIANFGGVTEGDTADTMCCDQTGATLRESSWPRYVTKAHRAFSSTK